MTPIEVIPDRDVTREDTDLTTLAGLLLFTTEPTDRALAGWCGTDYLDIELERFDIPANRIQAQASEPLDSEPGRARR